MIFLGKIRQVCRSFFDVRHSIKAKIFVCFTIATALIMGIISLYWYQLTIQSTTEALEDNMDKNMNSSLIQLENMIEDVKKMHSTLLYETNSLDYITNDEYQAPDSAWFQTYNQVYSDLRTMGINLARTVSGIGIFKGNGETCMNGILSLDLKSFTQDGVQELKEQGGNDVIFFLDKKLGETQNEIMKYIYVGRAVLEKGEEKAVIVTRLNDGMFNRIFNEGVYPNGFVLLLDKDYHVIYDSSPGKYTGSKETYLEQLNVNADTLVDESFMTFSQQSKYTGLTIVSAVPYQYIREINRVSQTQMVIMFLIVVIVVAVISMLISGRITSGLQSLSVNMKRVGDGTMTELTVISGEDEVGALSNSFMRMTNQIQKLLEDIKQNEEQKRRMEIKVLRAQISPHFLYNSLNTINYLAMLQNSENIHVLTSSLIELLQGAVRVDDRLILLEDEIKYVKSYLNIQQYRFPQQVQVDYQIAPEVLNCKVPKMILQPIVENAVIHGLSGGRADGMLRIKSYALNQEELLFSVTDNGVGMSEEKIAEVMSKTNNQNKMRFSGIGISNVDTRIKLQFGDQYGISIYSQEQMFTTVELKLPMIMDTGEDLDK